MSTRSPAGRNTLILTITNIINRSLGFVFRIVLVRLAGQEAIGLYQMMHPIFFIFLVIATAGIPIAVSKLVAEYRAQNRPALVSVVLRTSLTLALALGLAANLLLFALSGLLSREVLGEPRTQLALLLMAPSMPLLALTAAFRGYFQGIEQIKVVSTALLVEELTHIIACLGFIRLLAGGGPSAISAGLAAAGFIEEAAGLIVYLLAYTVYRPRVPAGEPQVSLLAMASHLLRTATPTTATRLVHSLSQLLQSVLIPSGLRVAGYTSSQAAIAFGELTGMALNLLFIPSMFTISLATTLLPQLTNAIARSSPREAAAAFLRALKWASFISLPCSALLITLGEPACLFLFASRSAGRLLQLLAWGGVLLYTQQISAAALQGLGRPSLPMFSSILGTAASAGLLPRLTASHGMEGAAVAVMIGMAVNGAAGLSMVQARLPFLQQWLPWLLRTGIAAVACGYTAHTIYLWCLPTMSSLLSMLLAGPAALLVYFLACKLVRAI
ncbi:MAG: oligosaccharide flippase family protein [Bacillota bacterium]|jgi:stage V sporulation protein B